MGLKVLDLFSGIGGFTLGLERAGGFETVAFCEINPERQDDLRSIWPGVPIYEDVRSINAADLGHIDVITGGFPCQDISAAGRRSGIHGERTGLFSQIIRLAGELRPSFIILENSADLLTGNGGAWARHVFGELATLGYDAEWHVIPAAGLGAPHIRERVWIIATDARSGLQEDWRHQLYLGRRFVRSGETAAIIADHYCERELQSGWIFTDQRGRIVHHPECAWPEAWHKKLSSLRSMDDGLPAGLAAAAAHRFGNTVVPQIPEIIGRAILEARAARTLRPAGLSS